MSELMDYNTFQSHKFQPERFSVFLAAYIQRCLHSRRSASFFENATRFKIPFDETEDQKLKAQLEVVLSIYCSNRIYGSFDVLFRFIIMKFESIFPICWGLVIKLFLVIDVRFFYRWGNGMICYSRTGGIVLGLFFYEFSKSYHNEVD